MPASIHRLLAIRQRLRRLPFRRLSLRERERGKTLHMQFSFFNAISYAMLAEGMVVLMLLQLGGSAAWVGAVGSLLYASLPLMGLGYALIPRLGVTGLAAACWATRSFAALFFVAAPWAQGWLGGSWGVWLVFIGAACFTMARAAGITSFTGIISELTTENDRGELISRSFMQNQLGGILVTLIIAGVLGPHASLSRYQLLMSLGLVCGLLAALALWRTPESGQFRRAAPLYVLRELRWLLRRAGTRWFFLTMLGIPISQGASRIFLVLLAKQAYGLADQQVILFTLVATLGGVLASFTYSLFLDQLGSRPLLVFTGILDLALSASIIALPATPSLPLLGGLFFLGGYVFIAFNACMQHYFIALAPRRRQLRLGVLAQGCSGIMGGISLLAGGWALEGLRQQAHGAVTGVLLHQVADPLLHFRWFFGALAVFMLLRLLILLRIPDLGAQRVRDSLNALFSPWDWRAIFAVRQAIRRHSEEQDQRALSAMARSSTRVYPRALAHHLRSPSFFVRRAALLRLALQNPHKASIPLLLEDLRQNPFTTAHLSAYVLGQWRAEAAAQPLHQALASPDFQLAAQAIHSLASLGKRDALPEILRCFNNSDNPRVIIEGARVISLWGRLEHLEFLLAKCHRPIPPQTKAEITLSITRLLGLHDAFYRQMSLLQADRPAFFERLRHEHGAKDTWGLLQAMEASQGRRDLLLTALEDRKLSLQPQFYSIAKDFLQKRPQQLWKEIVFLFTFLLLANRGSHLN